MNQHPPLTEEDLPAGRVVVRFAGDSGDGIQLLGQQFAKSTAMNAHDLMTFADFPAEIRAPVGTLFGVSAFQIQFGGPVVVTVGERVDVLVAFNAAALKTNVAKLRPGGLIIADTEGFNERSLTKAEYETDPLHDGSLDAFRIQEIEITWLTREVAMDAGAAKKQADHTKNFWALGLIFWIFGRDRSAIRDWIHTKFAKDEAVSNANAAALDAGHAYGETMELGDYHVPSGEIVDFAPGTYRSATGTQTLVWGLATATVASGRTLHYCSYPITPASGLLQELAGLAGGSIRTFQAEDEIAAVSAAIGASYAGAIGVTASAGPGIALKGEAMSLAVAAELPLVVINVQRAGPSTGMPTKTEQADLDMALHGRHGEAPVIVLAPATPGDCFEMALEAVRLAVRHMTPVILLADGYIVNAAEPWCIPDATAIPPIEIPVPRVGDDGFQPFNRDDRTLARPWATPGMPGLEHRIGGIERADGSGHISYDPENHQIMTDMRAAKIQRAADDIPPASVETGPASGSVAVVGWGSTYGPINAAVREFGAEGHDVAQIHLRHLSPLPRGLEDLLNTFDKVLVVEMNTGQLRRLLRAEFLIPAQGLNQITGQPFAVSTVKQAVLDLMEG